MNVHFHQQSDVKQIIFDFLSGDSIETNMERIVMPGDELWDPAGGFDLTANGLTTLNNGFDPVSPPPQQNNTETDAEFMHRTMLREELRVNILQRRLQKGLGAVQLDWRFTKPENVRKSAATYTKKTHTPKHMLFWSCFASTAKTHD